MKYKVIFQDSVLEVYSTLTEANSHISNSVKWYKENSPEDKDWTLADNYSVEELADDIPKTKVQIFIFKKFVGSVGSEVKGSIKRDSAFIELCFINKDLLNSLSSEDGKTFDNLSITETVIDEEPTDLVRVNNSLTSLTLVKIK